MKFNKVEKRYIRKVQKQNARHVVLSFRGFRLLWRYHRIKDGEFIFTCNIELEPRQNGHPRIEEFAYTTELGQKLLKAAWRYAIYAEQKGIGQVMVLHTGERIEPHW